MTVCPRCGLDREPHQFLTFKGKVSKWCDLCREAYVTRLRSLGLARVPVKAAREKMPLDALLDLARQSGAARQKAISSCGLVSKKAWRVHYIKEAAIQTAIRASKEKMT